MGVVRGLRTDEQGYEKAQDGTIYWTLSLYIEADKVAAALGLKNEARARPDMFRKAQRDHKPSLALANAVDPLMNDIADRETQGEMQEFLLAATAEDFSNMRDARAAVRRYEPLTFKLPDEISWSTEGVEFQAKPSALARDRTVHLRRFWLSHNNGALSYHLSFSHHYGADKKTVYSGYDPSTLYFLSVLQKLAAPKEYSLGEAAFKKANDSTNLRPDGTPSSYVNVFDEIDLGIDPLDNVRIEHHLVRREDAPATTTERFWSFVETAFEIDAEVLFKRLDKNADIARGAFSRGYIRSKLLDLVPFIEVPGLEAPKSRFMFMLHDRRFFDRLMPLNAATKEPASRKAMVQPACYEPYEARIAKMRRRAEKKGTPVLLDEDYWRWVCERPEYEQAVVDGAFCQDDPDTDEDGDKNKGTTRLEPIKIDRRKRLLSGRIKALVHAMRAGDCIQTLKLRDPSGRSTKAPAALPSPTRHHIPAFEAGRSDCLEYLFLAGFNQNIIDFMNQDTSEILDSIDPIYPDSEDQSSDRFFVRYANHRAMITYVPKSRSLETGNDYIGACPYAFLIHVLALHNEFLARGHEQKTMTRIERIQALAAAEPLPKTDLMYALQDREPLRGNRFDKAETAINQARLATFDQYERFRHDNPFRYETERTVFKTLEELRGISRKQEALNLAIDSLEDHAADVQRIHQQGIDAQAARRGALLNILLGMTGFFGAGQMFYWIGEKTAGPGADGPANPTALSTPFGQISASPAVGNFILAATEVVMIIAFTVFVVMLVRVLWRPAVVFLAHVPDFITTPHIQIPVLWRRFVRSMRAPPPRRRLRKRRPGGPTKSRTP